MKKLSILSIAFLLLGSLQLSFAQRAVVNIKGSASGVATKKIYLQRYFNKMFYVIDSSKIENGTFHFSKALVVPEIYGITVDTLVINPLYLFLDNRNDITVTFDSSGHFLNSLVKGSPGNDVFTKYQQSKNVKIEQLITENPKSIASAYILYRYFSNRLSPEELEKNIALLDRSLDKTQYIQTLNELLPVLKLARIGGKAPDFTQNDPGGKAVKLSSHFGKYILVDFWAAWCVPCRKENPNVVQAFNKYKDKGFEVFGVSFDRSRNDWVKAISDDGLSWTQVSDLAFWNNAAGKLYGIRTIPSNVLIDPNGNIIAKNLRAEELNQKLQEIFASPVAGGR